MLKASISLTTGKDIMPSSPPPLVRNADFYAISFLRPNAFSRRLVSGVRLVDGAWFRENAFETALPFHKVWSVSRLASRPQLIRALSFDRPGKSYATARQDHLGVWRFGEPLAAVASPTGTGERFLKARADASQEDTLGELPQF